MVIFIYINKNNRHFITTPFLIIHQTKVKMSENILNVVTASVI